MKSDRWVSVSMVLVGLLFGGMGAGAAGHYQYTSLRAEMRQELDKAEARTAAQSVQLAQVLVEIGKLQTMVENLRERIERREDRSSR